ncbi:MAG: hypothetical protein IE881_06375 [Epsilonproteobacteria bacterium]|nr:hypothetical protein [Campylobacterota bacterium]
MAFLVSSALLYGKDVPVMKKVSVEIPVGEYSIFTFPFKVTEIQPGNFRATKKVKVDSDKDKPIELPNGTKKITINKKNGESEPTKNGAEKTNILNMQKIDNMVTFRPKMKGEAELILWGNQDYPMIIDVKIVERGEGDKELNFVQLVDSRKEVINFEANPHEKVIENIIQYLYAPDLHRKPSGYEEVVRQDVYDVGIKDRKGNIFARVRLSLTKEVVGKRYVGQVWNANIVPQFDNRDGTVNIPEGFKLKLYDEMFDSRGVYAVSLETYTITKEHGTRVMVVRKKEGV